MRSTGIILQLPVQVVVHWFERATYFVRQAVCTTKKA